MTNPPDKLSFGLTPNPGDDDNRRSKEEEKRLLRAIVELILREAERSGIEVNATDESDAADEPNPERAEEIKSKTLPNLFNYTRRVYRSIKQGKFHFPDGTTFEGTERLERVVTELGLNLSELADLFHRFVDPLVGAGESIIKIAGKVVSMVLFTAGGGGEGDEEDGDPESSSSSSED